MGVRAARTVERLDDGELIRALKALADPTRFRMVQEVARAGELSCGQVGECFAMSQPTISHHLKILVDAGLLVPRAQGKHHFLSANVRLVEALADLLPARLTAKKR
jgi:ArsR family transcriptional regulator, arsenate/arsenite/antimonite-responsive transcriptional repressor